MVVAKREKYTRRKERERQRQGQQSQSGRSVGPIEPIANVRRRRKCERSLRLFCETYNPATFFWPWSPDHLRVINAIEESVFRGALLAFAMPRGSGKTALCRMAVLWAVSYAHVGYVYLIGANEEKAIESLDAVKGWMRDLDLYTQDFPEISIPVKHVGGIANRAAGQIYLGAKDAEHSTLIRWEKTRLVLPRVPKPPNMRWCRSKIAPTSGVVVGVSGLTGEGIRGSLFPHPDGRQIRPDLVLLDDPQTDESAASPTQNATRERLIKGAVLGMAGPGKRISAVMPCTVIRQGDMVDRLLDRKENPLWRGVRTQLLRTMPKHFPAWEKYFEVYRACMGETVPDIRPANAYYIEHRAELDEGADAPWASRKADDEVSAIQHAMNLYCERGKEAFFAEFQNAPLDETKAEESLTGVILNAKRNGLLAGVVPLSCSHVSAYVDVHKRILFWVVSAWEPEFGGAIVDYGTWPQQPLAYFAESNPPRGLDAMYGGTEESSILAGLEHCIGEMLDREFRREDGAAMRIGRLLIDAGYKTELVRTFCRRHPRAAIVGPALGHYIGATSKPFSEYRPEAGAQLGLHWRIPPGRPHVSIDTNWWKTFAATRLAMPPGARGGWEIFGTAQTDHRLFVDHCLAEEPVKVAAKGREILEWKWKAGRPDNHWWDCVVGSAAAGSMLGALPSGTQLKRERKKVSLNALAGARH